MRRLILITAGLAVLYAGFWLVGARSTLSETEAIAENLRAAGWQVSWEDSRLRGFPSRLDLTLEEPRIALPDGTAWSAPFLQSLQLTYRRNSAILVFPDEQTLTIAGIPVAVTDEALRASVSRRGVTAEAGRLSLEWQGHRIDGGPILAALRPDPAETGSWQLYLRAEAAVADGTPLGNMVIEGRARSVGPERMPEIQITDVEVRDAAALAATLATLSPPAAEALQRQ